MKQTKGDFLLAFISRRSEVARRGASQLAADPCPHTGKTLTLSFFGTNSPFKTGGAIDPQTPA